MIPHRANYLSDPLDLPASIPKFPHHQALIRGEGDPLLPHLLAHIDLTRGFARLIRRSAQLSADVSVPIDDENALKRLIEQNPIKAWTDNTEFFICENQVFKFRIQVPEEQKEAFQELVREVIDWRLADYLSRNEEMKLDPSSEQSINATIVFYDQNVERFIREFWLNVILQKIETD